MEHDAFYLITTKDHFVIKPKSNNHMVIIGTPDQSIEPNKYFETSIHIGNHCTILVKGKHKGTIQICLQSGEYPTELSFDENEGKFERKSTFDFIKGEKKEGSKQ